MSPEQISILMEEDAVAQTPPADPVQAVQALVQDAKGLLLKFDSIIQQIDKVSKEQQTTLPDEQKAALHRKMAIITKLIDPVGKSLAEINFQPRSNSIIQRLKSAVKPPPVVRPPAVKPPPVVAQSNAEIPFAQRA